MAQQLRPETIVHTAGLIGANVSRDPYRGVEVNIGGSMAVMEAARVSGVRRIVFCSSMAIYDFDRLPNKSLITESSPTGPKNLYGATKLACEHLLTQYGNIYDIEVVHLRLAGVYGRGQYSGGSWMGRILNRVLEASLSGQEVTIQPEWIGTNEYVYVKDVARAFALGCLAPNRVGGAYNIGTGVLHTFPQVITEIRALVPNAKITIVESDAPPVSYLVRDQAFDISKARNELGYQLQFTFCAGLQDYLDELQKFSGRYERLS
jgi:nucleoside-diphosphate-sugar epimerase